MLSQKKIFFLKLEKLIIFILDIQSGRAQSDTSGCSITAGQVRLAHRQGRVDHGQL
jgi:hypothetical protein